MSSESQDTLQSPMRSLRQRKSVDYSEQGLASRNSRRNSSVKASTAPDLEFIREGEEGDTDENDEAFIPSSVLNAAQDGSGKELFGFQTPKKAGAMAMKVAEEMRRTPLSEKNTPGKKVTPYKSSSNPTTPIRGIMKTPTRLLSPGQLSAFLSVSSAQSVWVSLINFGNIPLQCNPLHILTKSLESFSLIFPPRLRFVNCLATNWRGPVWG